MAEEILFQLATSAQGDWECLDWEQIGLAGLFGGLSVVGLGGLGSKIGNWFKKWLKGWRRGGKGAQGAIDFFEGTKYSDKVLAQMRQGDFHAFSEHVTAFAKEGELSVILGRDGVGRLRLKIPGWFKDKNGSWREGVYEFIKDSDGVINHRYFNPF